MPSPIELGERRFEGSRPLILGVLNVTRDSFSDGGQFASASAAVAHALAMREQGADIIDVGGESTRPGADPVSADEERARVEEVIRDLARRGVAVSVDTTKTVVARAAFDAGACLLNDVGMGDPIASLAAEVARFRVGYLRMHSRGTPATMRADPSLMRYPRGVVAEVRDALARDATAIEAAGVSRSAILLDPGLGFAKTGPQSIALLAGLDHLVALGYPVCVGPSRKSFIDDPAGYDPSWGPVSGAAIDRLGGTAAAVALAVSGGARAVRVHDVRALRQAARVAHAVARASAEAPP
jgi:dihydropteroate synthase